MFPQTPPHSLACSHGLAEINWERANKTMRGRREREREHRRVGEERVKGKEREKRQSSEEGRKRVRRREKFIFH